MRYILSIIALTVTAYHSVKAQNVFPSTGNVGIGLTNPAYPLHVAGNILINNSGSLLFRKSTAATDGPTLDLSGNGLYLHLSGLGLIARTNNLQDLGSGNYRFRHLWLGGSLYAGGSAFINSSGNSGVIVDGANASRVGFMKYGTRPGGIWRVANQDFEIGRTNTNSLPGSPTNFITDIYISGNGNVGIGTKQPGQKLSVNGNVLAKHVSVKLTAPEWADYVFDSTYKLMPVDSLRNFIATYKHLPEVPSAKEVEEKGLDVGTTQALLLKKIEELTLYVIEQHQKLDQEKQKIKERISSLHQEIKKLKATD